MNQKKFFKKIAKHVEVLASSSYSEGYDDGYNDGMNDGSDLGFTDGVKSERDRIIELFKARSQEELANGSSAKAKAFAMAAEIVDIANQMEKFDWSEEAINERYQEELQKDGF